MSCSFANETMAIGLASKPAVVNAALTAPSSLSVAAIVAKAAAGRETAHVLPPKPVLERAASEENEREPVKR